MSRFQPMPIGLQQQLQAEGCIQGGELASFSGVTTRPCVLRRLVIVQGEGLQLHALEIGERWYGVTGIPLWSRDRVVMVPVTDAFLLLGPTGPAVHEAELVRVQLLNLDRHAVEAPAVAFFVAVWHPGFDREVRTALALKHEPTQARQAP